MLSDEELDAILGRHNDWWDFARAVERATIERCAKVCEEISDEYQTNERFKFAECKTDAETGASDCETAIRAMLEEK